MSKSVTLSARIPAEIDAILNAEAARHRSTKSAALVALIRASQGPEAEVLLKEIRVAREEAARAADFSRSLANALKDIRQEMTRLRESVEAQKPRPFTGTASGWLGKLLGPLRLNPVPPAKPNQSRASGPSQKAGAPTRHSKA
jgi:hypothetical protein